MRASSRPTVPPPAPFVDELERHPARPASRARRERGATASRRSRARAGRAPAPAVPRLTRVARWTASRPAAARPRPFAPRFPLAHRLPLVTGRRVGYTRPVTTGAGPFFDAMAASYDDLEPWYEHLYAVLHGLVRAELAPPAGSRCPRALDAGCGTGFQTAILLELGYETLGLDISAGLLGVARRRCAGARLVQGDVEALPWRDETMDLVVSCGSTLSFVPHPDRALAEIATRAPARRPAPARGRAPLESRPRVAARVEPRRRPARLRRRAARGRAAPSRGRCADGVWIDYPGYPALRLFTRAELDRLLDRRRPRPGPERGVSTPSPISSRPPCSTGARLGRIAGTLYRGLCALDRALAATEPGRALPTAWSSSPRSRRGRGPARESGHEVAPDGGLVPREPESRPGRRPQGAVDRPERLGHDRAPPCRGTRSSGRSGVTARRWALASMKRWLEHGTPAAWARAAARSQPVTPPICWTSGMTRSVARSGAPPPSRTAPRSSRRSGPEWRARPPPRLRRGSPSRGPAPRSSHALAVERSAAPDRLRHRERLVEVHHEGDVVGQRAARGAD